MNDKERYQLAVRKMQSGVAFDQGRTGPESSKHLRVGVNVALVDFGSLIQLLLDKGIINDEEVSKALADGMEREVERYEKRLGPGVTLQPCGFPEM